MKSKSILLSGLGTFVFAIFYQWYLRDLLFVSLGLGRSVQPLSDFPYTCQRIRHERLEGCEDMWLDEEDRTLYAACSSSLSRSKWTPTLSRLNITGRRPGGDYISVLDIDSPGSDGLYGLRQLRTVGYRGANGDESLDLCGFDVEILAENRLRFWMVNHRPFVGTRGNLLDAIKLGANSTIDVFEVQRGGNEMVHVRTFADEAIATPNNIAVDGHGGFLTTNDKTAKVGLRRELDLYLGGESVAYCPPKGVCHIAASSGFTFPNGLIRGKDGLFYIPSGFINSIRVMALGSNNILRDVDVIHLGMPVDNFSVDKSGDIWAAAFPKVLKLLESFGDPYNIDSPTTVWRIRKTADGYTTQKILEDAEAGIVGGATVAIHDVKTGKLFISGAMAPYITICEPK